ncbi:asparagine synthetase A [Streptomyces sp. NPDC059740]|uniref:asparagine synthetase A n=1 Tax=Streptomyces sp. NPDC059740 TaxID=3346926 RepID=UPI00365D5A45
MTNSLRVQDRLRPPAVSGNDQDAFLAKARSPWYALVADLQDAVLATTVEYARGKGLRNLHLPVTTRTITCPSGLGSDSEPVPVTVSGVDTYLADSMQFLLEYGCRVSPQGVYTVLPSFRGEEPDARHLSQFTHSEAEIPGDLADVMAYVEGYVKALAQSLLDQYGERLAEAVGDVSHLERMAGHPGPFPRVTFAEAVDLLAGEDGCIRDEGSWRTLTHRGELELMRRVGEFVWVTHFDHLAVPFYQGFGDPDGLTATNADLLFGIGEVVGLGERHTDGETLRKAIAEHDVAEGDYAWYVRLKGELPMPTAGFGMGVERFLLWVLDHDDIRDIPLVPRGDEPPAWPSSVDSP